LQSGQTTTTGEKTTISFEQLTSILLEDTLSNITSGTHFTTDCTLLSLDGWYSKLTHTENLEFLPLAAGKWFGLYLCTLTQIANVYEEGMNFLV
jgi:hypothetical protein